MADNTVIDEGHARPLERTDAPSVTFGRAEIQMVLAASVTVICWAMLTRWYSLVQYATTPNFAFDKIPDHFNSSILRYTVLLFLVISALYVVGYRALRCVVSLTVTMKLAVGVLAGGAILANLMLYPVGALDVFNYIVELKVAFFYHQNPYIVPFSQYVADPFRPYAFYQDVSYYGPVWFVLSHWPVALTGLRDIMQVLVALKIVNLLLLLLTAGAIYAYVDDVQRRWLHVYLFLANPLVLFEALGNAHNDMMMTFFLIVAVLTIKKRSPVTGMLFVMSVLVKLFSIAVGPLLVLSMILRRWSRREILVTWSVAVVAAVVFVAPFWSGGQMLSGWWRSLVNSQTMNSASIFSLVREFLHMQGMSADTDSQIRLVFVGLFGLGAVVILWTHWRGRALESALLDTYLLFSVMVSLLQPWYLITVIALLALTGHRDDLIFLVAASALGLVYYPLSVWAWWNSGWPAIQIHLFQALFVTLPVCFFLGYEVYRGLLVRQRPRETIGG